MAFSLPASKTSLEARNKWTAPEDWDDDIVETAGFIPLEVRFKKLQENGQRVILRASEFDSIDMRKMYLDDEFRVEPDDDLEEIEEKLMKRQAYINSLREERIKETNEKEDKPVNSSKVDSKVSSDGTETDNEQKKP